MDHRLRRSILIALAITALALALLNLASACDMWAWITTSANNLSANGKKAYKESVIWYRYVSSGNDGDAVCDDGWSIWGHSLEQDIIDFRLPGAPYARQVFDQNYKKQRDGMSFEWAPEIPEGSDNEFRLDFTMSHSRAAGSNVNYNDPHPFVYQFGGRTLAMQHNGLLYNYLAPMQILIGNDYWNMDMFSEREFNGEHLPSPLNDSEIYAMLLMKNVLLADNYGEGDLWAINKTIDQILGSVSYSSLNIYFNNGEEIYAACKSIPSQRNDHRIWYAYNDPNNRQCACILTGNTTPGVRPTTWRYWAQPTELTDGNWYKIDRELLYPEGGSLSPVSDPIACEYAFDARNPMVGNDASIAAGSNKDYITVWEDDDGNIYLNYFDQMGLCESLPLQINPIATNLEYRNPDVVFDGNGIASPYYNHLYIVYETGLPGQTSNEICLLELAYDTENKTWIPGNPIVVNQNNSEVANPAVAWGNGKIMVAWQQTLPGVADWHIRTAAYLSGGSICMSDRIVGGTSFTEQRSHPDVLYIGNQNNGESVFVISYMQKDLQTSNHGVYLSRIISDPAPQYFDGDLAYSIIQNPDHTIPALTLADETAAYRFVCAFKESQSAASHQMVALRLISPLDNYSPTWYVPEETIQTTLNSYALPPEIDPRFFEISLASRDDGYVDAVLTDIDGGSTPTQFIIKSIQYACPFTAGSDMIQIDAGASQEDMDPVIAIAEWQGILQRLIVWDGYIDSYGETRLTANFDPPHFGESLIDKPGKFASNARSVLPASHCTLNPNYPNPFNPITTITYTLLENTQASLKVYDITGRTVATLAEGFHKAGFYQVTFDGSKLASGVYFYHLQAGNLTQTQKMILMK